jgi:hypothetical protein
MFEYIGVIHVHSIYSDGTGTIPEIAKSASELGLDFVMMTDHNTLQPKYDGYEGWYGDTMIIIGYELNDPDDKNHYLVFGVDEVFYPNKSAREYVEKIKNLNGLGIIAHPDERRNSFPEYPPYPWNAWDVDGFTGIEIWNHMSEWVEGLTQENKFRRFIHPLKSLNGPYPETLKRWDELSRKRRVIGIGGVDAHGHKYKIWQLFEVEVFPYKVMFRGIRTHVLLDEPIDKSKKEDFEIYKRKIFSAIENGRCFTTYSYFADPRGFRFTAEKNGKIYQMGDYIELDETPIKLKIKLPQTSNDTLTFLLRNGEVITKTSDDEFAYEVGETGVYRVESYFNGKPWIFSNHIRIGKKGII